MRKIFLLPITALLLLPSCIKYRKLQPIIKPEPEHFVEKNNIQVATKKLSRDDCKDYFGNKRIVKKYDVIQLCIKNNRLSPITLNAENISIPLETKRKVYKNLSVNTALGVFVGIAFPVALLCASLASAAVCLCAGLLAATAGGGGAKASNRALYASAGFAAGAVVSIPSTAIRGAQARRRNQNIKHYVNSIVFGLNDELTIAPGKIINKVIFVPKKQSKEKFDIMFIPETKFNCTI
jgi:hypothetical protein